MPPKSVRASGAASLQAVARQNPSSELEERRPGVVSLSTRVLAPKPRSPKNNNVHPVRHPTTPEGPPGGSTSLVHPFSTDTSGDSEDLERRDSSHWVAAQDSRWAGKRDGISPLQHSPAATAHQSFVGAGSFLSAKDGHSRVHDHAQAVERVWWSGLLDLFPISLVSWLAAFSLFFVPFFVNFYIVNFVRNGHSSVQRIAGNFVYEIRDDVVPGWNKKKLQRSLDDALAAGPSFASIGQGKECVLSWTAKFQDELRSSGFNASKTAVVNTVVTRLFGANWWPAFWRLEDILSNEVDLVEFIGQVGACASHNVVLGRIACAALHDPSSRMTFGDDAQFAATLSEIATYMLTLEALTAQAVSDAPFAEAMVAQLNQRFEDQELLQKGLYHANARLDTAYERDKYFAAKAGVEAALRWVRKREVDPKVLEAHLQLNVLEGALKDLESGLEPSGVVGLSLASKVEGRGSLATISDDARLQYRVPLGREWVDLYIAWNAVFLSGQSAAVPERTGLRLAKLFIPSVACAAQSESSPGGADFLYARMLSLFLDLNYAGWEDGPGLFDSDGTDGNVTRAWGHIVYRSLPWRLPEKGNVSDVGHALQRVFRPTGWSLFSYIATDEIPLVSAVSLLAACLLAATALESIMSLVVLPLLRQEAADSAAWMTEMLYSLFVMLALYAQSVWGIPFMIVGTWRAGIPECLSGFFCAVDPLAPNTLWQRIHIFVRAVSMGLHHTTTAFVVIAISIGYSDLDRDILAVCLPMAYEHLAAPLRYQSVWGYRVLVALLEVWWQFEAYYFLSNDNRLHEFAALYIMLAVHYCIIIADGIDGFTELCGGSLPDAAEEDAEKKQDTPAKQTPPRKSLK